MKFFVARSLTEKKRTLSPLASLFLNQEMVAKLCDGLVSAARMRPIFAGTIFGRGAVTQRKQVLTQRIWPLPASC